MPPSKSSKSKAAWERARKYAEQHGVSVKEARSILARQSDEPDAAEPPPKPKRKRATAGTRERAVKPAKVVDLSAAEAALRKKYPHIIAGTIEKHEDGPHKGRRTVEIQCQAKGCSNRRRIHTSDAFQVQLCGECTKLFRQQKRAKGSKGAKKGSA